MRQLSLLSIILLLLLGCVTTVEGPEPLKEAEKDPADDYYQLGVKYLQMKNYDFAESRLLRSIEIDERPETLNALAVLYEEMHDNQTAEKTYEKMVNHFPDYLLGYSNYHIFLCKYDRTDQMISLTNKMASKGTEIAALGEISTGNCLLSKGNQDQAITHFNKALTYEQYSAGALLPLAEIDLNRGFVTEAKAKIDTVHNYIGYTPKSLYLDLLVYRETGDSVMVRQRLRDLQQRFPNSEEYRRAMTYAR